MKKALEPITPEHLGECEKRIWRMERRRSKVLAGRVAGWTAGTIIFVLVFIAGIANADHVTCPPFRPLAILWKGICITIQPDLATMDSNLFACLSLLVSVPLATAVNLVFGALTRLIWLPPARKFVPTQGSPLDRAKVLIQRYLAAEQPSIKTRYLNLTLSVLCSAVLLLSSLSGRFPQVLGNTEELFRLIVLFLVSMLLFLLLYLLYWGLCHLFSSRIGSDAALKGALESYINQGGQKEQPEAEIKRPQEEQRRLEGDELYRQAIAGKPIDEDLIAEAAEMGCRPACLYMGRQLLEAWSAGTYTADEKQELAEAGKEYFRIAALEENFPASQAEAELGYLTFVSATECGDSAKWREILDKLRSIQSSGLLPEHSAVPCDQLIRTIVDMTGEVPAGQTAHDTNS